MGQNRQPSHQRIKIYTNLKSKTQHRISHLFFYRRRPLYFCSWHVSSDGHPPNTIFSKHWLLTSPDTPSQPISTENWQAQLQQQKRQVWKKISKAQAKAGLLGPTPAPDATTPSPRTHGTFVKVSRVSTFSWIHAPRSGGNDEEYRFIFTFIFKGIWVEEHENRVGSSAFADNADTHYGSFQTQAFQMFAAQQSWASEGHTWNPGAS